MTTTAKVKAIWRQVKITNDFRTYCSGRLYWRSRNPEWKVWHEADIAMVHHQDKTKQYFTSAAEIEEYIIDCLAYPEDRITRDFDRAKRKVKTISLSQLLAIAPTQLQPVEVCEKCGAKNSMVVVQVNYDDPEGSPGEIAYKMCTTCSTPDNQQAHEEYWHKWDQSDFPF